METNTFPLQDIQSGGRGFVGSLIPSHRQNFWSNIVTKKRGLKGLFIVKHRNTDQLLGNIPSPAGDQIP